MVKRTKKQFNEFVKWCKYYKDLFQLNEWDFFYIFKKLDNEEYAAETVFGNDTTATFCYNKEQPGFYINPKETARHEVIHTLIRKLELLARQRYITPKEIYDEAERLTIKLTNIIGGLENASLYRKKR